MGILNKQVAGNIYFATDVVSAVKQKDLNGLTNTLLSNHAIDARTAFKMNAAGNLLTAVKSRDVNALTSTLAK